MLEPRQLDENKYRQQQENLEKCQNKTRVSDRACCRYTSVYITASIVGSILELSTHISSSRSSLVSQYVLYEPQYSRYV